MESFPAFGDGQVRPSGPEINRFRVHATGILKKKYKPVDDAERALKSRTLDFLATADDAGVAKVLSDLNLWKFVTKRSCVPDEYKDYLPAPKKDGGSKMTLFPSTEDGGSSAGFLSSWFSPNKEAPSKELQLPPDMVQSGVEVEQGKGTKDFTAAARERMKSLAKGRENKEFWMPDENCSTCYHCQESFSFLKRRHHCRMCGQIFCGACSNNTISGVPFGQKGQMRVCDYCSNILQQIDPPNSPPKTPAQKIARSHSRSVSEGAPPPEPPSSTPIRSIAAMRGEARDRSSSFSFDARRDSRKFGAPASARMKKSGKREALYGSNSSSPVMVSEMRKAQSQSFLDLGSRLGLEHDDVTHLEHTRKVAEEEAARLAAEEAKEAKLTAEVTETKGTGWEEVAGLLDITGGNDPETAQCVPEKPPTELSTQQAREIVPSARLRKVAAYLMPSAEGQPPIEQLSDREFWDAFYAGLPQVINVAGDNDQVTSTEHLKLLEVCGKKFLSAMVDQLLALSDLDRDKWHATIATMAERSCTNVAPDVTFGDFMDIRNYVQVKKVPGGAPIDSEYVSGVVLRKTVAHKKMKTIVNRPRILLLSCALEYERIENRFSSFAPLLAQEKEYLSIQVSKIQSANPDIVVVEKSVSRLAQEYLLNVGLTLVLNVEYDHLLRVARCTEGDVFPSIDNVRAGARTGMCEKFFCRTYRDENGSKDALMFFEGCRPDLGATIIIRGGRKEELDAVESVLCFAVFTAYNLALERGMMRDHLAYIKFPEECPDFDASLKSNLWGSLSVASILSCSPAVVAYPAPLRARRSDTLEAEISKKAAIYPSNAVDGVPVGEASGEVIEKSEAADGGLERSCTNDDSSPRDHFGDGGSSLSAGVIQAGIDMAGRENRETGEKDGNISGIDDGACGLKERRATAKGERTKAGKVGEDQAGGSRKCGASSSAEDNTDAPKKTMVVTPEHHQSIMVVQSSYYVDPAKPNAPKEYKDKLPCMPPNTQIIDFLQDTDMSLGEYLYRSFDESSVCQSSDCGKPMIDHVCSYTHYEGRVSVVVDRLPRIPAGWNDTIVMWSCCSMCSTRTPCIPMSEATWKYSFGKYMELAFYGKNVHTVVENGACTHSVHRERDRFFGYRDKLLRFSYERITIMEVEAPSLTLLDNTARLMELRREELESVRAMGQRVYKRIGDQLAAVGDVTVTAKLDGTRTAADDGEARRTLAESLHIEHGRFMAKLNDLHNDLERLGPFEVNSLKRLLYVTSVTWDASISSLGSTPKSRTKKKSSAAGVSPVLTPTTLTKADGTSVSPHTPSDDVPSFPGQPQHAMSAYALLEDHSGASTDGVRMPVRHGSSEQANVLGGSVQPVLGSPKAHSDASSAADDAATSSFDAILTVTVEEDECVGGRNDGDATSVSSTIPDGNIEEKTHVPPTSTAKERKQRDGGGGFISSISRILGATGGKDSVLDVVLQAGYDRLSLPPGKDDVLIHVVEDEPSSIIAYSLASQEYHSKLMESIAPGKSDGDFNLDDMDDDVKEKVIGDLLKSEDKEHIKLEFENAKTKFFCKAYYAQQFHALRHQYSQGEDDSFFIESLAHCQKWNASGGKSGSNFNRTLDGRFILKQISRVELISFLEFAPTYFDYMSKAFYHQLPTALTKILGVYRVGTEGTASDFKQDIIVMENLFFNRDVKKIFDLKGSVRSRYVKTKKDTEQVLLDLNFLEYIADNPLYVREHSKAALYMAIFNDSLFLSKMNVMDYSLLVGIDETNNTLVIGIIDYIRQYTWDKYLENWYKSSGVGQVVYGGKGKAPTIITPKEYKNRFRNALMSYFVLVPDKHAGMDYNPITMMSYVSELYNDWERTKNIK